MTVFQFTYTTLFGFHSAFLFLRTSSLIPAITSHVFCNVMGFPALQYELRWYPHRRRRTPDLSLISRIGLIRTQSRNFVGVLCWYRSLHIRNESMDIATRQSILAPWGVQPAIETVTHTLQIVCYWSCCGEIESGY